MSLPNSFTTKRLFGVLWAAFVVQILGRLLDLQWHRTHEEFETGSDQVEAHWLVWLGTLLVLVVAVLGLKGVRHSGQRRGYVTIAVANSLYIVVAVVHFIQHVNHSEVDWTHIALAATNVAAVVGVLMVTATYLGTRRSLAVR